MAEDKTSLNDDRKETENDHQDADTRSIIHELSESLITQTAAHKTDAETNRLYAKSNVLLAETNNQLSKNIISLSNTLIHNAGNDHSSTNVEDKIKQMDKKINALLHKIDEMQKIMSRFEKTTSPD